MADIAFETTSVLVAGATGMLGGTIARELLRLPRVDVRLLARSGSRPDPRKKAALDALVARGATIVNGDLAEPVSLEAATVGVDVVISAVQGGRQVIVDGQVALAKAAAGNGVRRILPSDFALDLFKAPPGEHASFDLRRDADEIIADSGLEAVPSLRPAAASWCSSLATPIPSKSTCWPTPSRDDADFLTTASMDRRSPQIDAVQPYTPRVEVHPWMKHTKRSYVSTQTGRRAGR